MTGWTLPKVSMTRMRASHVFGQAESYDSAFFYEPGAYMQHLVNQVRSELNIHTSTPPRHLLDVGGGTGTFTKQLIEASNTTATVVDPFLEHDVVGNDRLDFISLPAEAFAMDEHHTPNEKETRPWKKEYDQILLKEVIHHLEDSMRVNILRGLKQGLRQPTKTQRNNQPAILVITRPQIDIDYPLWPDARQVWALHQPSEDLLAEDLKKAGFRNVQHRIVSYPCSIPMKRWETMVQRRFWSTFSNFSDEQIAEGCQRLRESEKYRIDLNEIIHFEDRLVFLKGYQ